MASELSADDSITPCLSGKNTSSDGSPKTDQLLDDGLSAVHASENAKTEVNKKRTRLMKRTSVDILPDYHQMHKDTPKVSKTASIGECDTAPEVSANRMSAVNSYAAVMCPGLRTSSSDSHLSGLAKTYGSSSNGADPMISMIDRDINSPIMFTGDASDEQGFSLEDVQRDTVAMDMGEVFESVAL
jgi:hypothetical protein